MSEQAATSRFDTVDLLRGLSILSVVLLHTALMFGFSGSALGTSLPRWLRYTLLSEGGNGVTMFFVISGFLITYTSIRRFGSLGRIRIPAFYRIRFARIAPPLLLLLLALSIGHFAGIDGIRVRPAVGTLPRALWVALTFQLNWFEAVHGYLPACWSVLWSLSVEEMFYLFFPLICALLLVRRMGWPIFYTLLGALILIGPFARTVLARNEIWGYQGYLANMDAIALGCLCAIFTERCSRSPAWRTARTPLILQITGILLALFIALWDLWPKVILGLHIKRTLGRSATDVDILMLATCLMLFGGVLRARRGSRLSLPLRWYGRHSYELYLTHEFIVLGIIPLYVRHPDGPVLLCVVVVILLSAALGYLVARFVSEPLNRSLRGAPLPTQSLP